MTSLPAEAIQRIKHFGDFVTIPLAIAIFLGLAGLHRLHLVLMGAAACCVIGHHEANKREREREQTNGAASGDK